MKKDILKAIKAIFIITIGFGCVDYVGSSIYGHFFNKMKNGIEYNTNLAVNKVTPEILIIGNSRAIGHYVPSVISKELNMSCFNAGMGAQHMDYQIAVANSVIARHKPQIIIWECDVFCFNTDNGVWLKSGLSPQYNSSIYAKEALDEIDNAMPLKQLLFSYKYNSILTQIAQSCLISKKEDNGYVPYKRGNVIMEEFNYNDNNSLPSDRKTQLFENTLQEWKSQGIEVYLFHSPYYKIMNKPTQDMKVVSDIAKKYNIPIFNNTQLEGVYDNPQLMRDAIHLCDKGAQLYSYKVAEQIKNNRIIQP